MNRIRAVGLFLLVLGLVAVAVSLSFVNETFQYIVEYLSDETLVNWGPRAIAPLFMVAIGEGFIATGISWLRSNASHPTIQNRIPALTILVTSIIAIIGIPLAFRPWDYTGFAQLASIIISGGFVLGGLFGVMLGFVWYEDRNAAYPTTVLMSGLALNFFYYIHQEIIQTMKTSRLVNLVIAIAIVPLVLTGVVFRFYLSE